MENQFVKPAKDDITPWGTVWSWSEVIDGVFWISTPIHGGLVIDLALAEATLSAQAKAFGSVCGRWLCFEEDCEVCIPLFEHPEWAPTKSRLRIAEWIRACFPDYFSSLSV